MKTLQSDICKADFVQIKLWELYTYLVIPSYITQCCQIWWNSTNLVYEEGKLWGNFQSGGILILVEFLVNFGCGKILSILQGYDDLQSNTMSKTIKYSTIKHLQFLIWWFGQLLDFLASNFLYKHKFQQGSKNTYKIKF